MSSTAHAYAIPFDTLQYAKKLKAVGFTEQQAEVQAEALRDLIDDKLATKQDLKELEINLKRDIQMIKKDLIIAMGKMATVIIVVLGVAVPAVGKLLGLF